MQISTILNVLLLLFVAILSARFTTAFENDDDFRRAYILPRFLARAQRIKYQRMLRAREMEYGDSGLDDIKENEKRFKPLPQGRSGGMSLCLWKVCPAAPWLMSKRPKETK